MIAGEALSAWLADARAQKRSLDAVETSAREWSRHPLMGKLDAELTALADPTPEQVLGAARRFMDKEDEIAAMLQAMIAPSLRRPFLPSPLPPAVERNPQRHPALPSSVWSRSPSA